MNLPALPCVVLLLLGACASTSINARPVEYPVPGGEHGILGGRETREPSESQAPPSETGKVGTHSVHVLVGKLMLDEDDWAPLDEPFVLGVMYAREKAGDPLGFELGLQLGGQNETSGGVDFTSAFVELAGGIRKTWLRDRVVQPYIGGGLSLIGVGIEAEQGGLSTDDDDSTVGVYVHGGVLFAPFDNFEFGLDLRIVRGTDISLSGANGDIDSEQVSLVFGWNF